ncbi:MAG: hypothetical protein ACPG4Z_03735 [Chitinophagales bacterium]
MKNTIYILFLLIVLGCDPTNSNDDTKDTSTGTVIDSTEIIQEEVLNEEIAKNKEVFNDFGEITPIKTQFTSTIRLNSIISLDELYTDTIEFHTYNDDYDYFYLEGEKDGIKVALIYDWDTDDMNYNFNLGDTISIQWKMDSIYIAGDGETLDFTEKVIDAENIFSIK